MLDILLQLCYATLNVCLRSFLLSLTNGTAAEILKEGWIKKQSDKSRNWKRRYFILSTDAILAYFHTTRKPGILGAHHGGNASPSSGASSNPPTSPPPSLGGAASSGVKVLGKMKASFDIWRTTQIGAIRDPDITIRIFKKG
jgi:hypothetical protein